MTAPGPCSIPRGMSVTVHYVGREREPVVVIDQASGRREELVAYAATRSSFEPAAALGSHYPGLLGPVSTAYLQAMVQITLDMIDRHFGTGPLFPVRARGNFSLVTTPSAALSPDQRVPHVDAADRMQFAAVHFLSADNPDGTAFFRHRATGFETIDADRLPAYRAALDPDLAALPTGTGYETGAGATFELIGRVDAVPDRMIVYRAALLHSGRITAVPPYAADPRRGRLTGNLFLQCRAAA